MAAAAMMARACWRFSIFICASRSPMEVESELQGGLASNLIDLEVGHLLGGPQLVEHFEERLVVPGDAGAGHGRELADFQRFRGHAAFVRKGLGDSAEDGQIAVRFVKPWPELFDLLLHA